MRHLIVVLGLGLAFGRAAEARDHSEYGSYGGVGLPRPSIDRTAAAKLAGRLLDLGYDRWVGLNGIFKPGIGRKGIRFEVNVSVRTAQNQDIAYDGNRNAYFAKIVLVASEILKADISEIELVNTTTPCKRNFYMTSFMDGGCSGERDEPDLALGGLVNNARGTLSGDAGLKDLRTKAEVFFRKLGAEPKTRRFGEGWFTIRADGMLNAVLTDGSQSESIVLYVFRPIDGSRGGPGGWSDFRYGDSYAIVSDGTYVPSDGPDAGKPIPFEPERFKELDAFVGRFNQALETGPPR